MGRFKMEAEADVQDQEVEDSDLLNYAFDDYNHQNSNNLNILDQDKPPVFPQQKVLAHNIYRRIEYILKTENKSFDDFERVDFQVRDTTIFDKLKDSCNLLSEQTMFRSKV